jgi:hypothetical protein
VGSVFFFCLSEAAAWSATPSVKFVCCPQVQEISSVAHQLFYFGVGFSLCLFTGGLFVCLTLFLWGRFSVSSAGPLLSVCYDGSLFVFQFCGAV